MKDPAVILRYIALLTLLLLFQITVAPLIEIGSVQPNILLIGLVYIAVRYGQLPGMFYAFGAGLLFDLFISDIIGLSSLAYTLSAFMAGFYHSEEKAGQTGESFRFLTIVAIASILFNAVYIVAYFQDITVDVGRILVLHGVGSMIYTTVLSAVPVLFLARKRKTVSVNV